MLAMNYQLSLPSDYDVGALRRRIPDIGKRFDDTPGLGIKAFLLREQGVDGSPVSQYAPFYLWTDPAAAATFLFHGGGFEGVIRKYGRPVVQTWLGGAYRHGPAYAEPVTHAVRRLTRVPSDLDPADTAAVAGSAPLDEPGLHSTAWAIDPRTWELMTLTLYAARPAAFDGELYEVPYVSTPDPSGLRALRPISGAARAEPAA